MTNKLLLICGETEESIKAKELLNNKKVDYLSIDSPSNLLSLVVPSTNKGVGKVYRGLCEITGYVDSLNLRYRHN